MIRIILVILGDVVDIFFEAYGNNILILFENETITEKGKW